MTGERVVRLSFPARAEYLILGRLALAGVARAIPIGDETLADLKLAVTEACGNVVRHAYSGAAPGEEGVARVTIRIRDSALSITIEDDGIGVPSVSATEDGEAERESGMGLAIIGAIADELDVRRSGAAGGTTLTFRKHI